jgi:hypothetical protein
MAKKNEILESLLDTAKELEIVDSDESNEISSLIKNDTEEDYEFARCRLKALIQKSESALDTMLDLAENCEHPRAFEVLGGLMKHSSDLMDQLLKLQEKRKKLHAEEVKSSEQQSTTNNAIFVGSTTDLQKYLDSQNEKT